MLQLTGKAGPLAAISSGDHELALGDLGQVLVSSGAAYADLVRRGICYRASVAVAGVALGTAIDTTAEFSLANPIGSGVDLVILELSFGYISGTLGAGSIFICANTVFTQALPTGGTSITPKNARIGVSGAGEASAMSGSTLAAAPSPVGQLCSIGPILATSVVAPWQISRDIAGGIVLAPGGCLSLQHVGTGGSSPVGVFAALYAEVPMVL